MAHDLQSAGAAQVDLRDRHEDQPDGGGPHGGARDVEQVADRARPQEHDRGDHRADGCRDGDGEPHDRPGAPGLALADLDRDAPDGRHIHPEPGRGAGHERQLGDQGDLAERRGALPEGPRDQDVHPEAGEDEDAEAHDVLAGASQDRLAVPNLVRVLREGGVFGGRRLEASSGVPTAGPVSRTPGPVTGYAQERHTWRAVRPQPGGRAAVAGGTGCHTPVVGTPPDGRPTMRTKLTISGIVLVVVLGRRRVHRRAHAWLGPGVGLAVVAGVAAATLLAYHFLDRTAVA